MNFTQKIGINNDSSKEGEGTGWQTNRQRSRCLASNVEVLHERQRARLLLPLPIIILIKRTPSSWLPLCRGTASRVLGASHSQMATHKTNTGKMLARFSTGHSSGQAR
jgi:hypothetical protein